MPPLTVPPIPPIPAVIPANQYPHLRPLIKELDYLCNDCSAKNNGVRVYHTFEEAIKEPLSAPAIAGKAMITKKGMYATRFAMFCPETRTVLKNGPGNTEGIVDLLMIPTNYQMPPRQSPTADGGLSFDDTDHLQAQATPAVRMRSGPPKGGKKKVSDLNSGKPDKAAKAKKKAAGTPEAA